MNKKFLSAILFGALMVTSTGTFVSCKDYDDDIDGLQTQVDANKSDCAAGIQAINSQISALQSALTTAQSTADAAKKAAADAATAAAAAKTAGDAAMAEAQAAKTAAEAAKAAAAQAKADAIAAAIKEANDLKAWVVSQKYVTEEALAEALLPVSAKIAAVEEGLDQIVVYIQENLEANLQSALKNIMSLQEDLAIQEAALTNYEALIEELQAADDEMWTEIASTREGLQSAITALNNLLEEQTSKLWEEIALARQELSGAITALTNIQADNKAELMAEIEQILLANKTTSETLAAILNTQADDKAELKNEIEQILVENTKLSETLAALINTQTANKAELETALGSLEESLETKIKNLEDKLGLNSSTSAKDIEALAAEIAKLAADNVKTAATIAALETSHAADKAALEKLVADTKAELSKSIADQIAALNTAINATMTEELDKVWTALNSNKDAVDAEIAALKSKITEVYGEITTKINSDLATLHLLVNARLTSLLFAPSVYVDGIEAIRFTTLQYLPWGDLKAKSATLSYTTALPAKVAISDNSTKAYYYVSPSYIDPTSINKLNVLVQKDVQNILSRAATPDIEATMGDIVNGKMTVNFKKNATISFGGKGDKFSIMALQAELNKIEGETVNPLVTSDWARIYEEHVTPYIHNADANAETATDSHFYTYAQIHSNQGNVVAPADVCDTDGQFIAKEVVYTSKANLLDFVEVCDYDGNEIAYQDYNMSFEFALVTYNLRDDEEGKTDQAKFAKIEGTEIISTSYNGVENNADAIGREPMIQVVLKDKANNKVVDVRYFKIKWIAKDEQAELGVLGAFKHTFDCNERFGGTIGTEDVNVKIYTALNVSKQYFHTNYSHSPRLFASLNDLKAERPAISVGTLEMVNAQGSTTTYNYKWDYTRTITEADYNAGKVVTTAYGYFYNIHNPAEKHIFTLTDEIEIPQMGMRGYVASQWNKTPIANDGTKIFQVNPALTSDATYGSTNFIDCQLITSLLRGYNKTGTAPAALTIDDITNDVTKVTVFEFDASRIAEVLGAGWSLYVDPQTGEVDPYTLVKTINGEQVIGAVIEGTDIRLYENPIPTTSVHGEPTEAAQLLLDKQVPVKVVGENCTGIVKVLDKFLVHFIDPLKMVIDQKDTILKDLITGGSSVDVSKAVQIYEKFGLKRPVVYLKDTNNDGVEELIKDDDLVKWYNIEDVVWDINNATTNLKFVGDDLVIDGQNITHDWSDCSDYYQLIPSNDGTQLTFKNNSGSHIQQPIKVRVPVYVQTKWNPALADPTSAYVELTIQPGDYE